MLEILSIAKISYKKMISLLFYILCIAIILLIIRFIYISIDWPIDNNLTPKEIVNSGYTYLIFGSQKNNGIELFDLRKEKLIPFIIPEKNNIKYKLPVVAKTGKGFCIRKDETDINNIKDAIVNFDVNLLQYKIVESLSMQRCYSLSISSDERKLAFIYTLVKQGTPMIGIFDVSQGLIKKNITIEYRFGTDTTDIIWEPDNEHIVIRDRASKLPSVEINYKTGASRNILPEYPRYYKDNFSISEDTEGKIYFADKKKNIRYKIKAGHSYILSRDDRYLVYGWARGMDRETLTIMDIETQKKYQIKLNDHPGTVLGLALW